MNATTRRCIMIGNKTLGISDIVVGGASTKRLSIIDNAKGIAIILVIIGHIITDQNIVAWIYSFHMPLFFCLSGYTLSLANKLQYYNYNSIGKFISKKIYQILLPFLIYALIFGNSDFKSWLFICYGTGESIRLGGSNPVLWFLPCFFVSSVILYFVIGVINRIKNAIIKFWYILLSMIVFFTISDYMVIVKDVIPIIKSLGYFFTVDVAFCGVGFMLFGVLISYFPPIKNYHYQLVFLLVLISLSIFSYSYNMPLSTDGTCHVDMRDSVYGNYFLFIVISCIGILSVIKFVECFKNMPGFLQNIGRRTITIMCLHLFVLQIILIPIIKLDINRSIFVDIILTILLIALMAPISTFAENKFPFLKGKIE